MPIGWHIFLFFAEEFNCSPVITFSKSCQKFKPWTDFLTILLDNFDQY